MAAMPKAHVTLLSIVSGMHDGKAIEPTLAERREYLEEIVSRMPDGPVYAVEVLIENDVAAGLVRYAMKHEPDVIVMATHGENRMIHRLFGDTAEQVVRSGVAPVLLVQSEAGCETPTS